MVPTLLTVQEAENRDGWQSLACLSSEKPWALALLQNKVIFWEKAMHAVSIAVSSSWGFSSGLQKWCTQPVAALPEPAPVATKPVLSLYVGRNSDSFSQFVLILFVLFLWEICCEAIFLLFKLGETLFKDLWHFSLWQLCWVIATESLCVHRQSDFSITIMCLRARLLAKKKCLLLKTWKFTKLTSSSPDNNAFMHFLFTDPPG